MERAAEALDATARGASLPANPCSDVLPVNGTMKKYKIYVTSNLNFLLADF